jgi:hypothetical protein
MDDIIQAVPFLPFAKRADTVEQFHVGFGHQGGQTMYDLLRTRFWWPKMKKDISEWLKQCARCQLAAAPGHSTHHAPMIPLDIPPAFSRWHLDFVGELPETLRGNKWLLVAVDYTTNWPIARALPEATGEAIASFIYEEIVMRFGCPKEILTDRGSNFMSNVVSHYLQRLKTNHKRTWAFHPRTNGKCERLNGIFKGMLRKYCNGAIHRWDDFIDTALLATRIRTHRTTGKSPFYLTYGREPVLPGDMHVPFIDPKFSKDPRVIADQTATELEKLNQVRAAVEIRMRATNSKDKERWDKLITPQDFEIGDHVLVRHENKFGLEYNWFGPFVVTGKNEETHVYRLEHITGEPYPSWVHTDRLQRVHADSIDTPWYNPTVSRAEWRKAMHLPLTEETSPTPEQPNQPPLASLGQPNSIEVARGRATSSGGSVVAPKRRFKPIPQPRRPRT